MLLKNVVYVTQFVSDQNQALDFYTRLLEFEKRADGNRLQLREGR